MMGFILGALMFSGGNQTVLNSSGYQFVEMYTDSKCRTNSRVLINIGTITRIYPKGKKAIKIKTNEGYLFYVCQSYEELIKKAKTAQKKLKETK